MYLWGHVVLHFIWISFVLQVTAGYDLCRFIRIYISIFLILQGIFICNTSLYFNIRLQKGYTRLHTLCNYALYFQTKSVSYTAFAFHLLFLWTSEFQPRTRPRQSGNTGKKNFRRWHGRVQKSWGMGKGTFSNPVDEKGSLWTGTRTASVTTSSRAGLRRGSLWLVRGWTLSFCCMHLTSPPLLGAVCHCVPLNGLALLFSTFEFVGHNPGQQVEEFQYCEDAGAEEQANLTANVTCGHTDTYRTHAGHTHRNTKCYQNTRSKMVSFT